MADRRRPGSLRNRLLFWLMASVTFVLAGQVATDWLWEKTRIEAEAQRTAEAALDRLALVLPAAIEDLDARSIRNAVRSELANPHVGSLQVALGGRILAKVDSPTMMAGGQILSRALPLPGGEAALVTLYKDPGPLAAARRTAVVQALIAATLANGLIFIAVTIIVSRIAGPVRDLSRAAAAMAAGDHAAPLPATGTAEVHDLADAFGRMRDAVRGAMDQLEQQNRELDQRVQARTAELAAAQQDLVAAARSAGMAEMATGVIHNIGNVLTGILVDIEALCQGERGELQQRIARISALIAEHREDLGRFILDDPRGRSLPRYLELALAEIVEARAGERQRLGRVSDRLDLIAETVATQQAYAGGSQMRQPVDLARTIADMLALNAPALTRRGIRVVEDLAPCPDIQADRTRIGHIVANLLKNAIEAMDGTPPGSRELRITLRPEGAAAVSLCVADQGCGFAPEDSARIFSYGFTTKATGHGFGLHFCANAMQEMGGSIRAASPGPGQGASMTLLFPVGAGAQSAS